jgi:hypothetical protein
MRGRSGVHQRWARRATPDHAVHRPEGLGRKGHLRDSQPTLDWSDLVVMELGIKLAS